VYVFYEPIRRLVLQFDEEELNEMYFENLLKHYYITIKSYYEVNFGLKEVLDCLPSARKRRTATCGRN
jgi:hypothetical protein